MSTESRRNTNLERLLQATLNLCPDSDPGHGGVPYWASFFGAAIDEAPVERVRERYCRIIVSEFEASLRYTGSREEATAHTSGWDSAGPAGELYALVVGDLDTGRWKSY